MNLLFIKSHSHELTPLLMSGHYPGKGKGWVANKVANGQVEFEQICPAPVSRVFIWFKAIRAISLTATFMPAMAVLLWLVSHGYSINYWAFTCAVFGLLFLQVSVNLFNDVGDYLKLIDLPSTPGGSGVIQAGWLTTNQVKQAALGSLVLGCCLGLPALLKAPLPIIICGILAVIGVVGYSGKPFNFKYRALGDASVFLLCGPILTIGLSYAALGELAKGIVLVGVYFGFAASTILNANNISDIEIDTKHGAVTLACVLGFRKAIVLQTLYYTGTFSSLLALLVFHDLTILLPFLLSPLVITQLGIFMKAPDSSDAALTGLRFQAAKLHLLLGILLCAALLISVLVNL